jgi:transcriptional regulator with XRE-family HTH domain
LLKTLISESPDQLFGRQLRLERERRRITLDSIAANTKIALTLLVGLERGDVSRWPSGIFRRSFIRDYAAAIGLDPDKTAREFLEHFPDPAELVRSEPAAAATEHPALRLTLADAGAPSGRGSVLGDSRSRLTAVACDLAACVVIGGLLFLALGDWWKGLAVSLIGYHACSIMLLGSTPGMLVFGPAATRDAARRVVPPPPPLPPLASSSNRSNRPFARRDGTAPRIGASETTAAIGHRL